MPNVRAHLTISGRVQGVFFRGTARQEARNLGLTGWVRNIYNGDVEAVAEGREESVMAFIDWCRRGPPMARVTDVKVEWEEPTGEFENFNIAF